MTLLWHKKTCIVCNPNKWNLTFQTGQVHDCPLIAGVFPLELPIYVQNVIRQDIHHWVRFLCSNFFQATLAHNSKGKWEWGGGEDLFFHPNVTYYERKIRSGILLNTK